MTTKKGFTLIELMVVIAIIAVLVAIAIPGLLSSQRSSNERNASASLKTLATAETIFRSNDRDGNRINDFWTGDVAGLFSMTSAAVPGSGDAPIKLIELSVASADSNPLGAGDPDTPKENAGIDAFGTHSPKAGYWYFSLVSDSSLPGGATAIYAQDTDGSGDLVHNTSRFGFVAYPDAMGASGKLCFILNEQNTIFKREATSEVKPGVTLPPGPVTDPDYANFPDDTTIKAYWSTMD